MYKNIFIPERGINKTRKVGRKEGSKEGRRERERRKIEGEKVKKKE